MKKEYDFSKGERGKYYHPDANFKMPVYLDDDVQSFYIDLARKKNIDLQILINKTIKSNMKLLQDMI
jgi:uncharacterized protein YueI